MRTPMTPTTVAPLSRPRSRHRGVRLPVVAAFALVLALAGCSSSSASTEEGRTVTVTHGPVPAPTLVANPGAGAPVGDVRIFHFDGQDSDGNVVATDWTMTTTGVDVPQPGVESRLATGTFTFGDQADQLILEGLGYYPGEGSTVEVSSSLVRSIIGGSGAYAGATGSVESTHLDDGTWTHVFHIE